MKELDEDQKIIWERAQGEKFQTFLKKWGVSMNENQDMNIPKHITRNFDLLMMFLVEHDFVLGIERKSEDENDIFGKPKEEWLNLALKYPPVNTSAER